MLGRGVEESVALAAANVQAASIFGVAGLQDSSTPRPNVALAFGMTGET